MIYPRLSGGEVIPGYPQKLISFIVSLRNWDAVIGRLMTTEGLGSQTGGACDRYLDCPSKAKDFLFHQCSKEKVSKIFK